MKTFNIILIVLILIVVGFFGWLYFVGLGSQGSSSVTQTQPLSTGSNESISSFTFAGLEPIVNGIITEDNHTVTLTVPFGTDVTNLTPTIEVSGGATVSPASGAAQDFTNTVTYTVTGSDGTHQDYTVDVVVAPQLVQAITRFTIPGQIGSAIIDQNDHTISLSVPPGTDVTNLVPTISLIVGTSMTPASGQAQDFTNPVTYSVTTADGANQQYVVTVTVLPAAQAATLLPSN